MAATEVTTSNFKDFGTSTYGSPGLNLEDSTEFVVLSNGAGNGIKFEFASAGWLVLWNNGSSDRTFTIPLDEPTEYTTLGVTFTDKTFTLPANQKRLVSLDSRYRKASDGYVYVEASAANDCRALVVKRYTIV
jgi:hypothetical protein|tara:strand:+ start:1024 stop:1422 length:399 start_codon:yes stop_codon:yes gene_type:complete